MGEQTTISNLYVTFLGKKQIISLNNNQNIFDIISKKFSIDSIKKLQFNKQVYQNTSENLLKKKIISQNNDINTQFFFGKKEVVWQPLQQIFASFSNRYNYFNKIM